MKAWHFVGVTLRDGRPVPADGVKLIHPTRPAPCHSGLHASLRPWDALQYAPGSVLCLVECGGTVVHQKDKLACTERTILARMNAAPLLRYFARQQALSVVHLWGAPDVVLDYLAGSGERKAAIWATKEVEKDIGSKWWLTARSAGVAAEHSAESATRAAVRATLSATRVDAESAARVAAWSAQEAARGNAKWTPKYFDSLVFDSLVFDAFADWL